MQTGYLTDSKMTFSEDFDSFSTWTGTQGVWDTSRYYAPNGVAGYEGELQWYVNPHHAPTASANPYKIRDGVLDITAKPATTDVLASIEGQTYTSGMITTYHSFSQVYGYFEMRAQLPAGQGLWPAFWLLPVDGIWPPELDVMEVLADKPNVLHTTVHTQTDGPKKIADDHYQISSEAKVSDTSSGFHIYGVNWEADKITWYFDGEQIFQTATPADMHTPMYMLANLAVGGNWPGAPDPSTPFPATMHIDYIRAYDSLPAGAGAASAPTPTSVPAPVTLGTGTDTVTLAISEDAYEGDARFIVTLDGVRVGGVQTATASRAAGQSQLVHVKGDFGHGARKIGVRFLNDHWGGTPSMDRNLYVTSVAVNGTDTRQSAALFSSGLKTFDVAADTPALAPAADPNTLVLEVSEDAWLEDARFLVSVDGTYIGGAHAVTASHALGQTQRLTFTGDFGAGPHRVSVRYINDSWGGSPDTDRNLYIHAVELDGVRASNGAVAFYNTGSADFYFAGDPAETLASRSMAASPVGATEVGRAAAVEARSGAGAVAFGPDDADARVLRLYRAALERLPDEDGLRFWVGSLRDGASLTDLGKAFLESPEFSSRFGTPDDPAFVAHLYESILGREGDAGGTTFWTDELARGARREDVLIGFSESVENRQETAPLFLPGMG